MNEFVTGCDVIAMTKDEIRNSTTAMALKSITDNVENNIAHIIKVGYTSAREGITTVIPKMV